MAYRLLTITDDAEFYLGVLRALQAVHRLFIRHFLADKHRVVHLDDLVASKHACPFCRTVTNDILYTNRILTNRELNADARERPAQVIIGNLSLASRDIDGMRVKFTQDLWHGLLHQVVDIDRIDILVVNDVEQVVEFVAT